MVREEGEKLEKLLRYLISLMKQFDKLMNV